MKTLVKYKYEILLGSLILQLMGLTLMPASFELLARKILLLQTILPGILLYYKSKKQIYVIFLFIALMLANGYEGFNQDGSHILSGSLFIIYFTVISVRLYVDIFRAHAITAEIISACFAGFILLGLLGSFAFVIIEFFQPQSFSNLPLVGGKFDDLQYYSYITVATVGFGDIAPLTQLAKKATVLLSLIGYFYSAFVTSIIIGKYIAYSGEFKRYK